MPSVLRVSCSANRSVLPLNSRCKPLRDTARVLGRYCHGIVIRTYGHEIAEELARFAPVPVLNGLTDLSHPCQVLADLFTVKEHLGGWEGKRIAWVGDGNNMANAWLEAAAVLGFELRLACPESFEPNIAKYEAAKKHGCVMVTEVPEEAVEGAHVINTDVWASMGQESEAEVRRNAFKGYTVDADLMKLADPKAIFLHCLPAHRGEEVAAEVIDGPQSVVWEEAENRLHAQKALLELLVG